MSSGSLYRSIWSLYISELWILTVSTKCNWILRGLSAVGFLRYPIASITCKPKNYSIYTHLADEKRCCDAFTEILKFIMKKTMLSECLGRIWLFKIANPWDVSDPYLSLPALPTLLMGVILIFEFAWPTNTSKILLPDIYEGMLSLQQSSYW